MKLITHTIALIFFLFTTNVLSQDTIYNTIDTLICSEYVDDLYFGTIQDTSLYDSEWFLFNDVGLFSAEDSIVINDVDSIVLISRPVDNLDTLLIDTIYFKVRFTPDIGFIIPPVACFDEDLLVSVIDTSHLYGAYTLVNYTDGNGGMIAVMDSLVSIFIDNGDSTTITANYSIPECMIDLDETFLLKTSFQPVSDFNSDPVCFGDSTLIKNNSQYDVDSAFFSLSVEGIVDFNESQDSFAVYLSQNNEIKDVFVEITQGICTTNDTFQIRNKLQPSAVFLPAKACENEMLTIENNSLDTLSNSVYEFHFGNGQLFPFSNSANFVLPDTLANEIYDVVGKVNNMNGCIDSVNFEVEIDSVTYVSFTGLGNEYCEKQDIVSLQANINDGEFNGLFIQDNSGGLATFAPDTPANDVIVSFSFTNDKGCTDSDIQFVTVVHPKPALVLDGLDNAYCEQDPVSQLTISDTLENAAPPMSFEFEVIKDIDTDFELVDSGESLDFIFDPLLAGFYTINSIYTDANGCFGTITNTTSVNPLPNVSLGSDTIIIPGYSIPVGNLGGAEPNVIYQWSDESQLATLNIDQPGIYFLQAIDTITACGASDTIKISFDSEIETDLIEIKIGPNPTQDLVTIFIEEEVQNIILLDVFGDVVSINGSSTFSTDSNGNLMLDLSNQESGYYYIIIPDFGNFLIVKI